MNGNFGGLITGACATVLAGVVAYFTAFRTAEKQLQGQLAQAQAMVKTAQVQAEPADRKLMDDRAEWLYGELRKEIERLNGLVKDQTTQIQAQAERIDHLDSYNIRLRRALDGAGIAVPRP